MQVYSLQTVLCELEMVPQHRQDRRGSLLTPSPRMGMWKDNKDSPREGRRLLLQGQFRYLDDWDAIIFLCNPM